MSPVDLKYLFFDKNAQHTHIKKEKQGETKRPLLQIDGAI